MEDEQHAKDVAALFERVGLATGKYREFGPKRTSTVAGSDVPALPAIPIAIPVSMLPLSAPAPGAYPQPPVAALPELHRVLAWSSQHGKPAPIEKKAATIALFSLAGGVGKTTIAATLTRILAGRSRRVVLANCGPGFALHYLLDARSQRMGALTFLHAPPGPSALPMTLIEAEAASEEDTTELMQQTAQYADQAFLDLPAALSPGARALLSTADHVLVPLLPDVHSALTLKAVEAELHDLSAAGAEVHYVLNRYDPARPLHREMRDQFETMLGRALLPVPIREDPRIQDAMRHCVTVADYAPGAEVIADFEALSQWSEKLLPRTPAAIVAEV